MEYRDKIVLYSTHRSMAKLLSHKLNQVGRKANAMLKRVPWIKHYIIQQQFRIEHQLINQTHITDCLHPSILHFSVNRAATQSVKSILQACAAENSLTNVRLHDYAFHADLPYLNTLSSDKVRNYHYLFHPKGYAYSVFGGMIEAIPNLDQYRTVLMVRDPRDILVSSYYAVAYSHSLPHHADKKRQFLYLREKTRDKGIDYYVCEQCEALQQTFQRYQQLLIVPYPKTYITRFEDMVADFPNWLNALLRYCELDISDRLHQDLCQTYQQLRPKKENIYHHRRKGQVGDFKEKLQSETICHLESRFSEVLTFFNYS